MKPWEESLIDEGRLFYRQLAPPENPRPLIAWARTVRVPPDSPKAKGKRVRPLMDPSEHHGQFEVLRVLEDRCYTTPGGNRVHVREVTILACVQDGKSLTLDLWVAHSVLEEAVHFVSAFPDKDRAAESWRGKLRPMIKGSGYGHLLPTTGPGSSDGAAPDDVLFLSGGRLYIRGAGAKNEAGQASVTGERVKLDEHSSMRPRFARLLANRNAAYGMRRLLCKTSTLKEDDARAEPTWQSWDGGTRGGFQYRCPHCQAWQPFECVSLEGKLRLVYDDADDQVARASAALVCAVNGCHITEADRRGALRDYRLVMAGQEVSADGTVTGEPPITEHWTIMWTAADSPLEKNLGDLAVEHRAAQREIDEFGSHDRMRQLYRDEFVRFYTADKGQSVALNPIAICRLSQASHYGVGEPPSTVRFLAAAVDVQKLWLYWGAIGFDETASDYLLLGSVQNLTQADGLTPMGAGDEPDPADYWTALDAINAQLESAFPREEGKPALVRRMLDLGYRMDALRPWLARHPEWTGVVGRGEVQVLRQQGATTGNRVMFIPGVADIREEHDAYGTWNLWMLDSDQIKAQVHNGLTRRRGEHGASYVPRGIEIRSRELRTASDSPMGWIARHLCAEQRRRDEASGEVTWQKVDGAGRHDFLDVWTYARAGGLAHAHWLRSQAPPQPPAPSNPRPNPRAAVPLDRRFSRFDRRR